MGRTMGLAAAGVLALTLAAPLASACEGACGYGGYGYGGYGYGGDAAYPPAPVYSYYAPVYAAPPVYSYSYFAPGYGPGYGYAPAPQVTFYTTRINVFRGPRWDYSAAYYRSRPRYRGCPRVRRIRVHSPCGGAYAGPYAPHMYGAVIPVSRRW